jgi:hypothetical protein
MIFWKKVGTLRARMKASARSKREARSCASASRLASADEAAPIIIEYCARARESERERGGVGVG